MLFSHGNVLVANAAVAGNNNQVRKIKLLVDTGSSYTVIRSTLLKSIGVEGLLGVDFLNRYPLMIYPQKAEIRYS